MFYYYIELTQIEQVYGGVELAEENENIIKQIREESCATELQTQSASAETINEVSLTLSQRITYFKQSVTCVWVFSFHNNYSHVLTFFSLTYNAICQTDKRVRSSYHCES